LLKLPFLAQDSSLSDILFRQKPFDEETLEKTDHIELHPLFEVVQLTMVGQDDAVTFSRTFDETYKTYNAFDYAAADEFCCRPSRTRVSLDLHSGRRYRCS
jgi:hypothetical protein